MNEDVFPKETQNPLTMEEKIQARMHIPQDDKPVVKVSYIFDLSLFEIANYYCNNKFVSHHSNWIFIGYPKSGKVEEHVCKDALEKKAVKNIALSNPGAAAAALCNMDSLKENIFAETTKRVMQEVVNFSKKPNCVLKTNSANSVSNLSNAELYRQLCEECPHLICFLAAVCKSGKPKSVGKSILNGPNALDAKPETRNALCAAACICLKQYNQKLSAFHYRNGLLLLHGGVKAATLQRCHHLGMTMSQKSCIRMQEKFGDDFDAKVVSWTEQTRETELMIRLLEEVKKQSFQEDNASHGAPFLINLSDAAVRAVPHLDESLYIKCETLVQEISGRETSGVSLDQIHKTIAHLRNTLTHFK